MKKLNRIFLVTEEIKMIEIGSNLKELISSLAIVIGFVILVIYDRK